MAEALEGGCACGAVRYRMRSANVTVEEKGAPRIYRLGLDFGPVVKAIFDEAGEWHARGRSLLPCFYTLGVDANGAFAIPDGAAKGPRNLSPN